MADDRTPSAAETVPCPVKGCRAAMGEPCVQAPGIPLRPGLSHHQRHQDARVADGHEHTDATVATDCRECGRLAYNRITRKES